MVDTDKRIETAKKQAIRQRNYRRVRDRALTRLSHLYPERYKELLAQEREKDEKENKAWLDITGRTNASVGAPTPHSATDKDANGLGNSGEARNVEGEA